MAHEHAADLVSMRLPPRAREAQAVPVEPAEGPAYPYGLRLRLETAQLAKLQLDPMPASGTTLLVYARAAVIGHSVREDEQGLERSVELQITDLQVEPEPPRRDSARVLYDARGEA